jgi:hypothetical protein
LASPLPRTTTVPAHDLVGQLLAAENLFARIDRALILQHDQRRHRRADVDDGDHGILRHGKLIGNELERVFHRERFDIDHLAPTAARDRAQPRASRRFPCARPPAARSSCPALSLTGPTTLEIEADFLDRIRDVLVGLDLDLAVEVFLDRSPASGSPW